MKRAAHSILQKYSVDSRVEGNDFAFLSELFSYHSTAAEKLNGMTGIVVGIHKDGEKETVCFKIEKTHENTEISYIKAVNSFVQKKENTAEQDAVASLQDVVKQITDILVQVLEDNPLMLKFLTEKLNELFPHKSSETRTLKYFLQKLLVLTEKFPQIKEFSIKICIERLLEIECEGDLDKLDQLMYIFLTYLHKNYSSQSYAHLLSVFKSHILCTYQTQYIQHMIPNLCTKNSENIEIFLSMLFKEVLAGNNVLAGTGYIVSFLLIYSELSVISVKYLLYYCLRHINSVSARLNVKNVLKYILLLVALKPELLQEEKIREKTQKILKHPSNPMRELPLQEGVDYEEVLSLSGYCGDLCYTSIYLPFHCEMPELKLSSLYFLPTQVCLNHKKRRRCMSIDIPKELQIRKRLFSIDETKFNERVDCASSITTVASYK